VVTKVRKYVFLPVSGCQSCQRRSPHRQILLLPLFLPVEFTKEVTLTLITEEKNKQAWNGSHSFLSFTDSGSIAVVNSVM